MVVGTDDLVLDVLEAMAADLCNLNIQLADGVVLAAFFL